MSLSMCCCCCYYCYYYYYYNNYYYSYYTTTTRYCWYCQTQPAFAQALLRLEIADGAWNPCNRCAQDPAKRSSLHSILQDFNNIL